MAEFARLPLLDGDDKVPDRFMPDRLSTPSLSATIAAEAIPQGGTINWDGGDALVNIYPEGAGAGLHLATQTGFSGPYLLGIGVDHANANGIVMSLKANGTGLTFDQWPAGGVGEQLSNRSTTPIQNIDLYAGAGGVQYALKSGQGYTDGVANGTTTFTSATAAFVAGDVGKVIASVQPNPNVIPAGTTIVSVTNATTVVLSAAATTSGTGLSFTVAGRANASTQNVIRVFDTDSLTILFRIRKGEATIAVPVVARDASTSALRVYGAASQTADLQSWRDSSTNILGRVNKDGYFMTRKSAAPADADIANGELAFWVDTTAGAMKLMIKAKQTDGTVRTGQVALS